MEVLGEMNRWMRRGGVAVAVLGLALGGAACGDDDDDTAETGTNTSDETTTTAADDVEEAAGGTVEVTASDYEFEGVPETVEAGSTFSLTTEEGGEPHEMVVFAKPADETRSIDELIELPQAELEALFSGGPPALVVIALPGTTDTPGVVEGTGTIDEPGNYIYVCTFPQGTTVEDIEASEGPLEGDTPPHFVLGMRGEFTVE